MNQSITRLTLDVSVQEKQASISVRQFDTMRRLVFSMVDRGLPYIFEKGVYAAISVNTSPVTSVFGGCVIKDGAVHFDLDKSLTLEPAQYGCDLILYASDHKVLTASSFDLIVFASNASDYASEAVLSNDFSAMIEATAEAKDAAAEAIDAARNANDAAELARDAEEDAYKATQRADEISKTLEDKLAAGEFQGEKGESAYEIAVMNGFEGTEQEWLASLKGDKGDKGDRGTTGDKGDKGDPGEGIPPIAAEDANKVLTANADGTTEWKEPTGGGDGLPEYTTNDNGKVLTVVGGVARWLTPTGGGGSGSGILKVTNVSNWLTKTVSLGSDCTIQLSWSSAEDGIPTGNGTLKVVSNGARKLTREISQGDVDVEVGKYLTAGANEVDVIITDAYGNSRTIKYTIAAVSVSISSYFDDREPKTGDIQYAYIPKGGIEATVHFLIDGEEIGTDVVNADSREKPYTIPAQAHGSHTLEVYFTGEVDGSDVESNHLYYDLICYEEGNTKPIITTSFREKSVKQYGTVVINYIVYTWNALTSAVQLKDGNTVVHSYPAVDRTVQRWSYKANEYGEKNLYIVSGDTVKPITFNVAKSDITVTAETKNLELHLSSEGRNNLEENPLAWSYGSVAAEMTGFNLKSDGWQSDSDGNTVLRVSGDARVNIPFNIFANDFRGTGKTIEIELATRDVVNYDAVVLSSWSGERGIKVTAQKALLKSEQSEIFTQYKENEHIRVAFCVEKRAENRLLAIYINGIMSGVVQYPDDDDFSQSLPVGISIGSNDCTVDIYCIRVYSNNLSRYQIVENWIADTQDVDTMIDRYLRNNVFDDYGNISIAKLPEDIPYLVLNAAKYSDLPQSKGDKKTVSGAYVDKLNPKRGFTFEGAEIDVQGTSSATYPRKNYKIKFKGGFVVNGVVRETYALRETSMPTDTFTFKADVASSEGANNVELAMFYDDTCPVKTPPQQADSRVRQGIEGYPCLAFYYDGTNYNFIGKYNFNNDKATEEVFGFEEGDESWEIRQNNTEMVLWKDDNFEGTAWQDSFEGRYPDKSTDVTNLQALATWLKSTDTTAVDTEEEKAERLAKFKNEFEDWFNKDAMIFNYIFTELFLMVDNRAKNAFPTRYDEDGKWLILPYDYDTAIGINNEGELKFGYELEDTDLIGGHNVFNGQDSVLYVNIRLAFEDEITAMYQELRNQDVFSYEEIERRFENHQSVWGESIFNEDARFKYIDPLVNDGSNTYLPMLQGSKAEQRKWWLYNRFRYLDSKYNAGDSQEDYIKIRPYAVGDITVTPYADIYAAAKYDSILVKERALRQDGSVTLENPLSGGRDADVLIYSASQLSSVGDLSGLKVGMADFSKAIRLSSLKVGSDASGYDNPNMTNLTVGNLTLLKELDVRNCSALAQAVDISGCTNIERVYFEGTAITGVKLPNGGVLKTLHLPATVTSLQIMNQKQLTDFDIPSYSNISTLRLENVDTTVFDIPAILDEIQVNSRVRIIGDIEWSFETPDEIFDLYDKLDTFRGLDENGNNLDKPVVSGVIRIDSLTGDELAEMQSRYPNITIDYKTLKVYIRFYNGETLLNEKLYAEGDAIVAPDAPTKESTAQFDYPFKGWSVDGVNVVEIGTAGNKSVNYYALFDEELRYYTVRFLNGDTVLQSSQVAYGEMPVYTGAEPTPEVDYAFVGWSPEIAVVTGDVDYAAQFRSTAYKYTKLLNKTIETYESETLQTVGKYAFNRCNKLTNVKLPSVTSIDEYAFYECQALTFVDLHSVTQIKAQAFQSCSALTTLIIRTNSMVNGASSFVSATPLSNGNGYVYVPSNLVDSYKASHWWKNCQIRAIEDYPDICG